MDNNFTIIEFENQNYIIKKKPNSNLSISKKISYNDLILPDIKFNSKLNPHANKSFFGLGWFTIGSFWSDGMRSSIFFNYNYTIICYIFSTLTLRCN